MMPGLINDINLNPESREMFLCKLNMIYQFKMKREMERERKRLEGMS